MHGYAAFIRGAKNDMQLKCLQYLICLFLFAYENVRQD